MDELVIIENTEIITKCRTRLRRSFPGRDYHGWCDDFDQKHDNSSDWFAVGNVEKKGSDYAFCRVTYKTANNSIPTELGNIDNKLVFPAGCCEINNLIYTKKKLAITMIAQVIDHLRNKGLTLAFCVVDTDDDVAYKLNTEVFHFRETGSTVFYPEVVNYDSKLPVIWKILKRDNIDKD